MLENIGINEPHLEIVLILAVGFSFASILAYIAYRLKLSLVLSYLIAGWLIGPYSPGFVADQQIAEQLAEIGVILMMFGVGLHLKIEDLLRVKKIAIIGAFGQTLISLIICSILAHVVGWTLEAGIVFGLAIGVASTAVLIRGLADNKLLHTPQGHVAIGWLIVEDIMTVAALILLPTLVHSTQGSSISLGDIFLSLGMMMVRFILLALVMFTLGRKLVSYALSKVVLTESSELLTLTILALTFAIAMFSALIFGTSMALGAFVAGLIINETKLRREVSINAMPMKDIFVVIFFLSVGMLFDPQAITNNPATFLAALGVVIFIKPLAAFFIAWLLKYPFKTSFTVAVSLAQIGEFSFILAEEAMKLEILPNTGYDIIVACSFVSISLNPILFKLFRVK